jgi:MFS family permease
MALEAPVDGNTAAFGALRSRDFRRLFVGQLVSLTGSQMQQVAVAWQLYLLTRSPLSLGLLGLCRVGPVIALALGGGVIADALDRRRLMIVTQTALASSSLLLAIATLAGHATPFTIYGAAVLAGVAVAFDAPARQALLPLLVSREQLPNALSMSAMAWQLAAIFGPAIGGTLIAWRGVVPIYLLDAASFGAVIAALAGMRRRAAPSVAAAINLRAAVEGVRFLIGARLVLITMLLDFAATFFAGAMLLMPIFANEILAVGPRGLGFLYAAQPVGAAVAALVLSARSGPRHPGATLLVAVAIYGGAIALFGISRSAPLSLALLAVSGAADTVSMVIRQTLRQMLTPDELRGRMTSVNMIFFMGGPQLGEVEAGVVARAFGARFSVASGGLACVAGALIVALAVPRLRRFRYEAAGGG